MWSNISFSNSFELLSRMHTESVLMNFPLTCDEVLLCFGHGKKQRVCGSTQVHFRAPIIPLLFTKHSPLGPCSNNTFASAAPLGEHTKGL